MHSICQTYHTANVQPLNRSAETKQMSINRSVSLYSGDLGSSIAARLLDSGRNLDTVSTASEAQTPQKIMATCSLHYFVEALGNVGLIKSLS